ncbi:sialidase family protein [Xanthomonas vesicatoria]|uniref:Exo-alpha-sialidase n=2 Tax=Xanthomonas vesicatoria TaxID=56460 RepID=A0AAJ0J0W3_9XANT|nr:sialidase family protein [Xanthomonas vesicatoria]APO94701.1 exo-alpha-sialidase [Xanthomonas vesicatoria]APP74926.1 exo-alpha-sialidase [Xanthomonas vesicatoria ATCC 35937]EGD11288.1 putative neuraminidase (sialidase) [Xanthomonas vesicatoria ATCC 35937]KHM93929.1 exported exo-alpha-sialidase [Xanthomonas vesicatoria]KHM96929.1 exported exo-alpha-sialidase [Xanthomonas vesicatoria]
MHSPRLLIGLVAGLIALSAQAQAPASPPSPIVLSEFIADPSPTPQAHASTLLETRNGRLLAAWFGGAHEGAADVGIWLTERDAQRWRPPRRIADGTRATTDGATVPAWNPVLFQSATGSVQLYYKLGPNPRQWWGLRITSADDGAHWSVPRRLPDGILGPIKNKPVQLPDGRILAPSSSEDRGWRAHLEWSDDDGEHWQRGMPLNDPSVIGAIQPSLLLHGDGRLQALGRSQQNKLFSTFSYDGGLHWQPMQLIDVENPNSGTDAVMLRDGRALLVYNPAIAGKDWWDGRGTLAVALSNDGVHWQRVLTLEDSADDEFSYPAVIQTRDGLVHVSYTWKRRRIKHVVLDPTRFGKCSPCQAPAPAALSERCTTACGHVADPS